MTQQLIPLSRPESLEIAGAGTWNIESIIPANVRPDLVGVNASRLNRWTDYLIGLGDLAVETAPDSAFQEPEDKRGSVAEGLPPPSSKGMVSYSPAERQLPSSYRRPHGKIIFNESAFCKQSDEEDLSGESAETNFARHLDRSIRTALLDLVTERYGGRGAMLLHERLAGFSPYIASIIAEFAGANLLTSSGIFAALYAIALGPDYRDAHHALGKGASPGALKLKRWSTTPCGLPVERHTEVMLRSTALLQKNPKPKIVKAYPA